MSRSDPSYRAALRAIVSREGWRRQRAQSGPSLRQPASASPHRTHVGAASLGTSRQHDSQIGPASGRVRTVSHAAHAGARSTRTATLAATVSTRHDHCKREATRISPDAAGRAVQYADFSK